MFLVLTQKINHFRCVYPSSTLPLHYKSYTPPFPLMRSNYSKHLLALISAVCVTIEASGILFTQLCTHLHKDQICIFSSLVVKL